MKQRTCGRCGVATPYGLRFPGILSAVRSPWSVAYCKDHQSDAEAAREAEMKRVGVKR